MDIIEVKNKNGTVEQMEAVTIFDIPNSGFHYIIYKSFGGEYFVGKYKGEEPINLITDFGSSKGHSRW